MQKYDWISIEPAGPCPVSRRAGEGFIVVGHYTAPESSVMAGRQMRHQMDRFDTLEQARAKYPKAEVQEGCHNPLLEMPPAQFTVDPADAGEVYGEDEY